MTPPGGFLAVKGPVSPPKHAVVVHGGNSLPAELIPTARSSTPPGPRPEGGAAPRKLSLQELARQVAAEAPPSRATPSLAPATPVMATRPQREGSSEGVVALPANNLVEKEKDTLPAVPHPSVRPPHAEISPPAPAASPAFDPRDAQTELAPQARSPQSPVAPLAAADPAPRASTPTPARLPAPTVAAARPSSRASPAAVISLPSDSPLWHDVPREPAEGRPRYRAAFAIISGSALISLLIFGAFSRPPRKPRPVATLPAEGEMHFERPAGESVALVRERAARSSFASALPAHKLVPMPMPSVSAAPHAASPSASAASARRPALTRRDLNLRKPIF